MNCFREHFFSKVLTVLTAAIFLNMSFFLAEVSLLELEKDGRFSKIIALIVSGTCFEEEKETGGDTTEEEAASKKIEVVFQDHCHPFDVYIVLSNAKWIRDHSVTLGGIYETVTPPPES
ncbi:MAG: hypothetical protein WEB30_05765 [Cyclobacteriaceae bacterium]